MAVDNAIVLVAIAIIFVYLVVYKKNKLMGNIAYLLTGIGIWLVDTSDNLMMLMGTIIFIGGLISLYYDLFGILQKQTS